MMHSKTLTQIRQLLEKVESAKEAKDKISKLILVKILIEEDIERLRKARDSKQAAYDAKTRIIKKALKQFLTALDKIFAKHEEIGDTDVKQRMYDAVHDGFIVPRAGYTLPKEFGMFSEEGEQLVRAALQSFLAHPEVSKASKRLKTPKERLAAFQDASIKSNQGMYYDEFFGYRKEP